MKVKDEFVNSLSYCCLFVYAQALSAVTYNFIVIGGLTGNFWYNFLVNFLH
jgi:hypothetical protein